MHFGLNNIHGLIIGLLILC